MSNNHLAAILEQLFRVTGAAHHEAFLDTDGVDPEWPLWYADYLKDRLNDALPNSLTKAELIYLLVMLDKQRGREAPDADWTVYNARYFADTYG